MRAVEGGVECSEGGSEGGSGLHGHITSIAAGLLHEHDVITVPNFLLVVMSAVSLVEFGV
jgi:hypothetical protein